jgi:hypothetical protein
MSVEELERAVAELPPDKLAKFEAWFERYIADAWDKQIEQDAKNGKLDRLFEESMEDLKAGRIKEI